MPTTHPYLTETPTSVTLNPDGFAEILVARMTRRGLPVHEGAASDIAFTLDEALSMLASRRFARGEGATRLIEPGKLFGDAGEHVSEQEMDAAIADAPGVSPDLLRQAIFAARLAREAAMPRRPALVLVA